MVAEGVQRVPLRSVDGVVSGWSVGCGWRRAYDREQGKAGEVGVDGVVHRGTVAQAEDAQTPGPAAAAVAGPLEGARQDGERVRGEGGGTGVEGGERVQLPELADGVVGHMAARGQVEHGQQRKARGGGDALQQGHVRVGEWRREGRDVGGQVVVHLHQRGPQPWVDAARAAHGVGNVCREGRAVGDAQTDTEVVDLVRELRETLETQPREGRDTRRRQTRQGISAGGGRWMEDVLLDGDVVGGPCAGLE